VVTIEGAVEELERKALELQPDIGQTAMLAQEVLKLKRANEGLLTQVGQIQAKGLGDVLAKLDADLALLRQDLNAAQQIPVSEPQFVDMRWKLPTATGREYPKRSLRNIKTIVVGHTATLEDVAPEVLARTHVEQGKPGIACHFLVARDGTIYWTQPLEMTVTHTLDPQINRSSVAASLAGNFNGEPPCATQLRATAGLLSWLVSLFGLDVTAICGRREVEAVPSPGAQWLSGANYKGILLALVRERLDNHSKQNISRQQVPAPLATEGTRKVAKPQIIDVVSSLPTHPVLASYPNRTAPISVLAIHHTDSPKTTTVQQIAQYHVYGVRSDAEGNLVKAQWPGIGYHFVIAPNGTIYQGQREQTRSYHVGSNANDYCLGISFIGRFMRLGYDGKVQAEEDQIPTAAQLRSGGQLVAWLMQEFDIPIEKVLGHRNVVGGYTACPGEHWESGLKWRNLLIGEVQAAMDAVPECEGDQPMEHYLLFWDHGSLWAAEDWENAQAYVAHFRPTTGFSVEDAKQARHVTIVGGPSGVSAAEEARLRAACIDVHRLAGADQAATKVMLDELVTQNTPWPGAPPRVPSPPAAAEAPDTEPTGDERFAGVEPDEWTIPDNWEQLLVPQDGSK
jgi:N-acetyl-anhydromuramyl-L-alanine amidase AmpD